MNGAVLLRKDLSLGSRHFEEHPGGSGGKVGPSLALLYV